MNENIFTVINYMLLLNYEHREENPPKQNEIKGKTASEVNSDLLFLRRHSAQSRREVLVVQLGREVLDYQ